MPPAFPYSITQSSLKSNNSYCKQTCMNATHVDRSIPKSSREQQSTTLTHLLEIGSGKKQSMEEARGGGVEAAGGRGGGGGGGAWRRPEARGGGAWRRRGGGRRRRGGGRRRRRRRVEAAGSLTASPRRSGSPEARRLVCWIWPRMAKSRVVGAFFYLRYRLVAQTGTKCALVPVGGTNRYQRSTKNCARTAVPLVPVFLTNRYQRIFLSFSFPVLLKQL